MLKPFVYVQSTLAEVLRRDRGATAVEYGMIVALIAAIIAATVLAMGNKIAGTFNNIVGDL